MSLPSPSNIIWGNVIVVNGIPLSWDPVAEKWTNGLTAWTPGYVELNPGGGDFSLYHNIGDDTEDPEFLEWTTVYTADNALENSWTYNDAESSKAGEDSDITDPWVPYTINQPGFGVGGKGTCGDQNPGVPLNYATDKIGASFNPEQRPTLGYAQ